MVALLGSFMSKDFKKILFATDLSTACRNSYDYTVSLAMACQASITLLHVIERPSITMEAQVKNLLGEDRYEQIMREHEKDTRSILIGKRKESDILQSALFKFCEDAKDSHPGCYLQPDEILIRHGDVVQEILETAKAKESSLIIMSMHRRSSAADSGNPSLIKTLLQLSEVPILIVPPVGEE
jgi:nucleotide-binding universal stress UspA family protein